MPRSKPLSELDVTSAVKPSQATENQLLSMKRAQRVNNELYFRMHPELRTMTSAFISALLADKPDDVALYAEQFFTNPDLARSLGLTGWSRPESPTQMELPEEEEEDEFEEAELNPELGGATELDAVDLENMLITLFKEADGDNSGALDKAEFESLMHTAQLGLKEHEIKALLADVDEDNNGTISYDEFVPFAVEVVQTMRLKQRYEEYADEMSDELRCDHHAGSEPSRPAEPTRPSRGRNPRDLRSPRVCGATLTWRAPLWTDAAMTIIGLTPEQCADFLRQAAERLGSGGVLTKSQVKSLLKQPTLGLSKQQANAAASELAYDAEGNVSVDTLYSTLYETLLRVVAEALAQQNLGEVGVEIANVLGYYDKEGTGQLDKKVVKTALLQTFPFCTKLQITAVVADLPEVCPRTRVQPCTPAVRTRRIILSRTITITPARTPHHDPDHARPSHRTHPETYRSMARSRGRRICPSSRRSLRPTATRRPSASAPSWQCAPSSSQWR